MDDTLYGRCIVYLGSWFLPAYSDGFSTGTMIGITVGVLLGIGSIAGIIIVAVRKMSGRYS